MFLTTMSFHLEKVNICLGGAGGIIHKTMEMVFVCLIYCDHKQGWGGSDGHDKSKDREFPKPLKKIFETFFLLECN